MRYEIRGRTATPVVPLCYRRTRVFTPVCFHTCVFPPLQDRALPLADGRREGPPRLSRGAENLERCHAAHLH